MTFWNKNLDLLLLEIVGLPAGLGLAFANNWHTQSLFIMYGVHHQIFGQNLGLRVLHDTHVHMACETKDFNFKVQTIWFLFLCTAKINEKPTLLVGF